MDEVAKSISILENDGFDITPWTDRISLIEATYAGT